MSTFTYAIEHVLGELNLLPDIMTRWMIGYRRDVTVQVRRVEETLFFDAVTVPPEAPEFVWPSVEEIVRTQQEAK